MSTTDQEDSSIQQIPQDILLEIFTYLDEPKDLVATSLACKQFRDICKSDSLWKQLTIRDFGVDYCRDSKGNFITPQLPWKKVYENLLLKFSDNHLERNLVVEDLVCPLCDNQIEVPERADFSKFWDEAECSKCHFYLFYWNCRSICGVNSSEFHNRYSHTFCRNLSLYMVRDIGLNLRPRFYPCDILR